MENARFLKISIIILLLINIGTLSYLWMGKQQVPPQGGPHGGPDVFTFLCNELKLDDQQVRQYEELRDEHHQSVENIQHHSRQLREQFFDMLHSNTDSSTVKKISDSIAATQEQIELVTFYHFKKVRNILRPDQQKRFDEVIQEATRMMAPGPPPPHPR